tara:strand:+ start:1100 stop:2461 length:1362 start_codon:yes stop_codon:yes gene_type:complete
MIKRYSNIPEEGVKNVVGFEAYRVVIPLKKALILGDGKVIDNLYNHHIFIGAGEMSTVASPLWGGIDEEQRRGNHEMEILMGIYSRRLFDLLLTDDIFSNVGSVDIRRLQREFMSLGGFKFTDGTEVQKLVEVQVKAPFPSALAVNEAIAQRLNIVDYLDNAFSDSETSLFLPYDRQRQFHPALTIGGKTELKDANDGMETYGKRRSMKFKIGTMGIEQDYKNITSILDAHKDVLFIMDNNQAYTPETCKELMDKLDHGGYLKRLLFMEQPFNVGEEIEGMKVFKDYLKRGFKISLDESVADSSDVARLGKGFREYLDEDQMRNIVIVPKIEKGGIIEVVEMAYQAKKYNFVLSPSTLTGNPGQVAFFYQLFTRMDNVLTYPGDDKALIAEANGVQTYKNTVGRKLFGNPRSTIHQTKDQSLAPYDPNSIGIHPAAKLIDKRSPLVQGPIFIV